MSAPPLAGVLYRNIEALLEFRRKQERRKTLQDRAADVVTRFAGSMTFVYLHALLFGAWFLLNTIGAPGIGMWDPYPFVMLAMIASVEAIFLSTFVLISQNRMAGLSERQAQLDLQISLLAEHEITRLIRLVDAIALRLGVEIGGAPSTEELKHDIDPAAVLDVLENVARQEQRAADGPATGGD